MKQSTSGEDMHSQFDEDEIEVADILLNLGEIIAKSETRIRLPLMWASKGKLGWGAKRKRSTLDSSGPPETSSPSPSLSPSPSQALQKASHNERDGGKTTIHKVKVEATSPATPLSFSPSESDERSKHCYQKIPKKKPREELLTAIKTLTARKSVLEKEVENVRSFYNKLLAFNKELKATKQQLKSSSISHKREEPQLETMTNSYDIGLTLGHRCQISGLPHQQPFIFDPMALGAQTREQFQYSYVQQMTQPLLFSSNSRLGRVNHVVGPVGIPDLNVTAEENCGVDSFRPSDYSRGVADDRVRYAEARRNRKVKMKERAAQGAVKPPRYR